MQAKGQQFFMAGDIGGTKTHLGLFHMGKRRPILKVIESYPSGEASGPESLLEHFLNKHPVPVKNACFGIAGPVIGGRSQTTNLPWHVSEKKIRKHFGWSRIRLINDLTATAMAIPLLRGKEIFTLNKGRSNKGKNMALIAPGTGLGEALLVFREGQLVPVPSEGGHVDFAPSSTEDIPLWAHLHRRFGHVSIERVLSGPGLMNIYAWLKGSGKYKEPLWLAEAMKNEDPAKAVTKAALEKKHPLCVETLNRFVSLLGAAAGNLALTGMATGGVYLGGGIPPKILPKLKEDRFMKAFTSKGRFQGLLEAIPVRVILNEKAALLGAAHCAAQSEIV